MIQFIFIFWFFSLTITSAITTDSYSRISSELYGNPKSDSISLTGFATDSKHSNYDSSVSPSDYETDDIENKYPDGIVISRGCNYKLYKVYFPLNGSYHAHLFYYEISETPISCTLPESYDSYISLTSSYNVKKQRGIHNNPTQSTKYISFDDVESISDNEAPLASCTGCIASASESYATLTLNNEVPAHSEVSMIPTSCASYKSFESYPTSNSYLVGPTTSFNNPTSHNTSSTSQKPSPTHAPSHNSPTNNINTVVSSTSYISATTQSNYASSTKIIDYIPVQIVSESIDIFVTPPTDSTLVAVESSTISAILSHIPESKLTCSNNPYNFIVPLSISTMYVDSDKLITTSPITSSYLEPAKYETTVQTQPSYTHSINSREPEPVVFYNIDLGYHQVSLNNLINSDATDGNLSPNEISSSHDATVSYQSPNIAPISITPPAYPGCTTDGSTFKYELTVVNECTNEIIATVNIPHSKDLFDQVIRMVLSALPPQSSSPDCHYSHKIKDKYEAIVHHEKWRKLNEINPYTLTSRPLSTSLKAIATSATVHSTAIKTKTFAPVPTAISTSVQITISMTKSAESPQRTDLNLHNVVNGTPYLIIPTATSTTTTSTSLVLSSTKPSQRIYSSLNSVVTVTPYTILPTSNRLFINKIDRSSSLPSTSSLSSPLPLSNWCGTIKLLLPVLLFHHIS